MTLAVKSAQERRAEATAAIQREAGIDEAMIDRLLREFYVRVRRDAVLGPTFAERIDDWEPHLRRIIAFWSSVVLMTSVYYGQPMQKHLPPPIDVGHFDRCLSVFEATARDLSPPKAADCFADRAHRIAESLELGLTGAQGVLLAKGERFRAGHNG